MIGLLLRAFGTGQRAESKKGVVATNLSSMRDLLKQIDTLLPEESSSSKKARERINYLRDKLFGPSSEGYDDHSGADEGYGRDREPGMPGMPGMVRATSSASASVYSSDVDSPDSPAPRTVAAVTGGAHKGVGGGADDDYVIDTDDLDPDSLLDRIGHIRGLSRGTYPQAQAQAHTPLRSSLSAPEGGHASLMLSVAAAGAATGTGGGVWGGERGPKTIGVQRARGSVSSTNGSAGGQTELGSHDLTADDNTIAED